MITQLDAVNYCLSILGSTPVGDLNDRHPDADICLQRVVDATKAVQKDGLWFNKELCWTLTPDATTKEIVLPTNTLKVLGIYGDFVIQRGTKLYDTINNTYQFEATVDVDLVVELAWDELPFSVQELAKFKAAQAVCEIDLEDHIKAAGEKDKATEAEVTIKKEDMEITRRSALYSKKAYVTRSGVRPARMGTGINPMKPGG